jgi:hypothetical protein
MVYVAEMKCELAYDNYRYLRLTSAQQLDHHKGAAFVRFLESAKQGHNLVVKVDTKVLVTDGAILVWGATAPAGVQSVQSTTGVFDVLSLEEMIDDLKRWQDPTWTQRVGQISGWCDELFEFLGP